MAQISISVTSAAGTVTVTKDIPAAHLARVIAFLGVQFASVFEQRRARGGAESPPAKTDANIFRAWANSVLKQLAGQVRDYEQRVAVTSEVTLTDA
jgi:hypothetical protein